MSTGTEKVPLHVAQAKARAFIEHLVWAVDPLASDRMKAEGWETERPPIALRWVVAGSVRRCRPEVGDIEHVVVPRLLERSAGGLFGQSVEPENRVWSAMQCLVDRGLAQKALYGEEGRTRWGDKYRGIVFMGVRHEVFLADERNFGSILAIRTGPASIEAAMMQRMRRRGYVHHLGYVRKNREALGEPPDETEAGIVHVPSEEQFFLNVLGVPCLPPERRDELVKWL